MTTFATIQKRNRRAGLVCVGVAVGMVGLAYASVPLYELFCRITGYGGTTQRADVRDLPLAATDKTITVSFDSNVAKELGWSFQPERRRMAVKIGERNLAFYTAANKDAVPTTGAAAFNVTPHKAGRYFSKIACFCFDEQRLEPGQSVNMPVQFFIDPEILNDPNTRDVEHIALSYTFFLTGRHENESPAAAEAVQIKPGGPEHEAPRG